jgi:HPt (histidine-containing phosphotransfer) domain-containing protein
LKIEDLIEVPEVENSQATVKTEEHEVLVETFSKTESVEEESEKINNADITKNANFKDYNSELQEWNAQQFMDILDDFIGEAEEIIEELEKSFMVIERDSGNLELLNSIFRNMHTLKGNSGTLNLKVMNFIAHRAENILDKVRTKKLTITPEIKNLLI